MLWHMLLFGDAFGPAYWYAIFVVVYVCVRLCCFFSVFCFHFELCACLLFAVCDKWVDFRGGDAVQQCVCVCVFSSHLFWTSSSLDVPPRSHRRKVTQDFSSTFFLRCMP